MSHLSSGHCFPHLGWDSQTLSLDCLLSPWSTNHILTSPLAGVTSTGGQSSAFLHEHIEPSSQTFYPYWNASMDGNTTPGIPHRITGYPWPSLPYRIRHPQGLACPSSKCFTASSSLVSQYSAVTSSLLTLWLLLEVLKDSEFPMSSLYVLVPVAVLSYTLLHVTLVQTTRTHPSGKMQTAPHQLLICKNTSYLPECSPIITKLTDHKLTNPVKPGLALPFCPSQITASKPSQTAFPRKGSANQLFLPTSPLVLTFYHYLWTSL